MLSRRNVRIKVMQLLYASTRDKHITLRDLLEQYNQSIEKSYDLYLYTLYLYLEVVKQSQQVFERNKSKLRPSDEELHFKPTLFENSLSQSFFYNDPLKILFAKGMYKDTIQDTSVIYSIYLDYAKTEEYQTYIHLPAPSTENHMDILLNLFKFCISHETFSEILDDYSPSWINDRSLVVGAVKKTIKSLPVFGNFFEEHRPSDETINEFGKQLLISYNRNEKENLELIKPALVNWEVSRVAIIDMLLIKMSLCEFLNFPTIPTKVTLNEYVDIAKMYSTDKSKEFVNGLLDRLMKQLQEAGQIEKEGRGLVD